jgi:hypothetical protein
VWSIAAYTVEPDSRVITPKTYGGQSNGFVPLESRSVRYANSSTSQSQGVVALHERGERATEGVEVHRARQLEDHADPRVTGLAGGGEREITGEVELLVERQRLAVRGGGLRGGGRLGADGPLDDATGGGPEGLERDGLHSLTTLGMRATVGTVTALGMPNSVL